MAINEVTQPSSGASSDNSDYTEQNILINSMREIGRSILTDWESEVAEPSAGLGCFIRHGGLVYQVQGTDAAISGTPAAGINYIEATVVGTVMTLAWVTVTTSYAYNEAYAGVYNGSVQLLTDICYKDGTAFKRGRGNGMDFNTYILADGSVIYTGGLDTNGGDINTGGGDIDAGNGTLIATGGVYGATAVDEESFGSTDPESDVYTYLDSVLGKEVNKFYNVAGFFGSDRIYTIKRLASSFEIYYLIITAKTITSGSSTQVGSSILVYA